MQDEARDFAALHRCERRTLDDDDGRGKLDMIAFCVTKEIIDR